MALCIRFCLEYALAENLPKIKNKIIKQDINDRVTRLTIGPNNKSLLTLDKDNLSDDYDIDLINNENTFSNNNNTTNEKKIGIK